MSAQARYISGDRLHLQHGPIDLIIGAQGAREDAFRAAWNRFASLLDELMAEASSLRKADGFLPRNRTAKRMFCATARHHPVFVTPMAAVAGAVADTILEAMKVAAPLSRAYVNNGGDIALHLSHNHAFTLAMQDHTAQDLGRINIRAEDPVRGIATSARHGRSLSFGIADSVTVLARTAAEADVAATLIANAVDLPNHPAIARMPANQVDPNTDLGTRKVVTHCADLDPEDTSLALRNGLRTAQQMSDKNLIHAAALFLNGQSLCLGPLITTKSLEHA